MAIPKGELEVEEREEIIAENLGVDEIFFGMFVDRLVEARKSGQPIQQITGQPVSSAPAEDDLPGGRSPREGGVMYSFFFLASFPQPLVFDRKILSRQVSQRGWTKRVKTPLMVMRWNIKMMERAERSRTNRKERRNAG